MNYGSNYASDVTFSGTTLIGEPVQKLTRTIGDLKGLFVNQNAFEQQDTSQIAYEVESLFHTRLCRESNMQEQTRACQLEFSARILD